MHELEYKCVGVYTGKKRLQHRLSLMCMTVIISTTCGHAQVKKWNTHLYLFVYEKSYNISWLENLPLIHQDSILSLYLLSVIAKYYVNVILLNTPVCKDLFLFTFLPVVSYIASWLINQQIMHMCTIDYSVKRCTSKPFKRISVLVQPHSHHLRMGCLVNEQICVAYLQRSWSLLSRSWDKCS